MSYLFALQNAPAPGREGSAPAAPAPQTGEAAPSAPEGGQPPAGGGSMFGTMSTFLIFLLPLALIFFMSRGQNKKQKQLEENLKVGDRVVTRAGAIGKVVDLQQRKVKIELAPGVNVMFLKTAIEGLDDDGAAAGAKKDDKDDKSEKDKDKKDDK